jgi:menaquinone-dependent protoporphyrinogen oxidase
MSKVLVTYATKHKSTEEIAYFIGNVLRGNQFKVDVIDIDSVDNLDEYSAVIIGSAVYIGQWLKSATNFLRHHQNQLAKLPVWIFSTGPTGEGSPDTLLDGFLMPENIHDTVMMIQPRHVILFHGRLDRAQLGIGERMMINAVKAPLGDFRDWHMIRAWANRIMAELQSEDSVQLAE